VSLSSTLQKRIFRLGPSAGRDTLKREAHACTDRWYRDNPSERESIRRNLAVFGLEHGDRTVDAVVHHIALHYYEKMIPLYGTPADYASYLRETAVVSAAAQRLAAVQAEGRACLLAVSHFGAVELITPSLALHGLDVSAALRFTTQQLSDAALRQARAFHDSGLFGQVQFVEVGKPGVPAALEMAAVVRRGGLLVSVCDERTDYSIPVILRGRRVWGGAGLDRLVRFARAPYRLFAAFMVRTGDERYRLELTEVDDGSPAPVQALFDALGAVVERYPEQWYFLHEDPPLVEGDAAEAAGPRTADSP